MDTHGTYHGDAESGKVTADGRLIKRRLDLKNHSPTGLSWGYSGSGPAQCALAILADATGNDELALKLYQSFKRDVIAGFAADSDFDLPAAKVLEWVDAHSQGVPPTVEQPAGSTS